MARLRRVVLKCPDGTVRDLYELPRAGYIDENYNYYAKPEDAC